MAITDSLTGLLNRRRGILKLGEQLDMAKRYDQPFSCAMVDIDYFKYVNDVYGHLVGDNVLRQIATILSQSVRKVDHVYRVGGEEFLILLPNTEKKSAWETAERIRKIVEQSRHPFNGENISYTVSFGVSSFDIDAQNVEELLENADIALYEAKSKGRNRVEIK